MEKNLLQRLRALSGMTQEETASIMGVSTKTLQNWETFKIIPKVNDLNKLLDTYHADKNIRRKVVLQMYGLCDNTFDMMLTVRES